MLINNLAYSYYRLRLYCVRYYALSELFTTTYTSFTGEVVQLGSAA